MKLVFFAVLSLLGSSVFAASVPCIDTDNHAYEVRFSDDKRQAVLLKSPYLTDASQKMKVLAKFDCRLEKGPIVLADCKEQGSPDNAYWFLVEDTDPSTFPTLNVWREDSGRNTRDLIVHLSCLPKTDE